MHSYTPVIGESMSLNRRLFDIVNICVHSIAISSFAVSICFFLGALFQHFNLRCRRKGASILEGTR